MGMTASMVTYRVAEKDAEELARRINDHLVPAAIGLKGYRGFLLLDQGEGTRMAILLFDAIDDARAAQEALTPIGAKHTYALMTSPAIGALCPVLIADGIGG